MSLKRMSAKTFLSIRPRESEIRTNYCPIPVIEMKSSADTMSIVKLEYGQYVLTLEKLADENVTVTMACGLHTMWSHTMNYKDARSIYNYYLKGWK